MKINMDSSALLCGSMGVPRLQINKFLFFSYFQSVDREKVVSFILVEWYVNTRIMCGDYLNLYDFG